MMKSKIILFLCAWSITLLYQPLEANGGDKRRRNKGAQQQQGRAGGHHGGGKGHHHGHGRGRGSTGRGGTGAASRTRHAHRGTERGRNWHHGKGASHAAHWDDSGRLWFFYNNAWLWVNPIQDEKGQLGCWIAKNQWLPLGTKENLRIGTPIAKQEPTSVVETPTQAKEAEEEVNKEEIEAQQEEESEPEWESEY